MLLTPEIDLNPLIDAVIEFANSKGDDPQAAVGLFTDMWGDLETPSQVACMNAHRELKAWLEECIDGKTPISADVTRAMMGTRRRRGEHRVEFSVLPGFRRGVKDVGQPIENELKHHLFLTRGSLSSACAYAVAYLYHSGLNDYVGQCARPEYVNRRAMLLPYVPPCHRYFIDKRSRGQPQEYCNEERCNAVRVSIRQQKFRPPKHSEPETGT